MQVNRGRDVTASRAESVDADKGVGLVPVVEPQDEAIEVGGIAHVLDDPSESLRFVPEKRELKADTCDFLSDVLVALEVLGLVDRFVRLPERRRQGFCVIRRVARLEEEVLSLVGPRLRLMTSLYGPDLFFATLRIGGRPADAGRAAKPTASATPKPTTDKRNDVRMRCPFLVIEIGAA
jgi:hypothetical protein